VENAENTLSLNELLEVTNENFIVTFYPSTNVKNYTYILYKDGKIEKQIEINENKNADIAITGTGKYNIEINITNTDNTTTKLNSGYYLIDQEEPVIEVTTTVIKVKEGKSFDPFEYVYAYDNKDGNITDKVTCDYNLLNLNELGIQSLTYKVLDSAGNETTKTIVVNVVKNNDAIIYTYQGITGLLLIGLIFLIIRYKKKKKIFDRISNFSVESLNNIPPSLSERILSIYMKALKFVVRMLNTSTIFKKIGKKYNKYLCVSNLKVKNGLTLVANKILFAILFTIVVAFSKAALNDVLSISEAFLMFILGFYIPDIKYIIQYHTYKETLENDLLQAVVIMNNCFKTGMSITQAIQTVGNEMNNVIGEEFKQMYSEIKFGLSIEDVFRRFSERIGLKEANYMSASLTILNKTGGNIVKIFDAIEKTLFNKRKIKNEYKALTGSPKLISNFLFALPLIFVILIIFISPTYFNVFFTNIIGIILFIIVLILYIGYIFIVKKIFKIRMWSNAKNKYF